LHAPVDLVFKPHWYNGLHAPVDLVFKPRWYNGLHAPVDLVFKPHWYNGLHAPVDLIPPLFGKQEVGIWWVKKCFPRYGVPIWSLWPNIIFLPSIVAEKNAEETWKLLENGGHIYVCG
jgi:hypothetical protein